MIEKEVLIHRDKINLNDIKATIFRKNIEDKQTNDVTEPSNIRITEGIIDSKIYEEKIIEKNPIDDKKYSDIFTTMLMIIIKIIIILILLMNMNLKNWID